MCNYLKHFINFNTNVDETVRYQCRSADKMKISDKEIFKLGDKYFFYMYNRNGKVSTFSLREVTKEEYYARKDEFFRARPDGRFGEFEEGDYTYFIGCFKDAVWKKNMPMNDCIFISENPLKDVYDAVASEIDASARQKEKDEATYRKEYARMCGALGNRLGIAYVNVLRIGPNEENLREFKRTYADAVEKVKKLSLSELRHLQLEVFKKNRTCRRNVLVGLGVKFFNADVMLMDLSDLDEVINKPLKEYADASVEMAIETALDFPFEERMEFYHECENASSRSSKRTLLAKLGVETEALDLNTYPFAKIKHQIQASLGIDNY